MNARARKNRFLRLLITTVCFVAATLTFQNCVPESSLTALESYQIDDIPIGLHLEKSMSENLKQVIIGDLVWYSKRTGFDGVGNPSYANDIFGMNSQTHLKFFDDRLNFGLEGEGGTDPNIFILASNPSILQWMRGLSDESYYRYAIDDTEIVFDSGRAGAVVFYDFAKLKYRSDRVITLAHEARHSDCTGGLPASFVSSIDAFFEGNIETPNLACGHFHTICPSDHKELAGIIACDSHLWGAYSIGAILAQVLTSHCTNCSESEKQVALAVAADSFSRILERRKISDKTAPPPDLSNQGVIEGQ